MEKRGKRGQAGIVGVVLLILLVIVAAGITIAFVVPFIRDKLSSGSCLDVLGKIEISSGYTCYDSNNKDMLVQIHIGEVRSLINGFTIELGGPSSKSFKILNGTSISSVSMYGGGVQLQIPGNNEERTYVFDNIQDKPDFIKVYPVLETGKTCDVSDTITVIENC